MIGCTPAKHGPTVTGEFKRYRAIMSQGGQTLPELPDAVLSNFPSVVRFDARGYEVDGAVVRIKGQYRFERDSIFMDQEINGKIRPAFAGRLVNDTLHVHWIPDYDVGPGSTEADWQLSFARSHKD